MGDSVNHPIFTEIIYKEISWKPLTIQGFLYYNKTEYKKALTKTVGYIRKAKRFGDGERPVRVRYI